MTFSISMVLDSIQASVTDVLV
uniref:Uncharacterized protein n=1 Tax=Arundo donax TaxID=35708 RepID=A0A0A9B389_ARUDO